MPDAAGGATTAADPRLGAATGSTSRSTCADLAAHAAMSVRTFTRRFREETGLSPVRWLTDQRVELARRLLESTDLPVDRIAAQRPVSAPPPSLRQHLHAAVGVAPLAYRRTYRPAAHVASWRS